MKGKSLAGCVIILVILGTSAFKSRKIQSYENTGLYLTAEDFYNHKLTYGYDCNTSKGKLNPNRLFDRSKGWIIMNGEKHSFDKDKIYGYENGDNKNYRFFGKEAYQIIDTAEFYLYYRYDQAVKVKGSGIFEPDKYFFSANGASAIEVLTVKNLIKAFPDNHRFQYEIDGHFKTNRELIAYDDCSKSYKLKYFYSRSLK